MNTEQIATNWVEAFNARDLDRLLDLYAENCRHTSPKLRAQKVADQGYIEGRASLREWWRGSFERLPSLRYEPTLVTASDRAAVLEYVRHVDGEAPMPIAEVFEIVDGKISSSRVYHG